MPDLSLSEPCDEIDVEDTGEDELDQVELNLQKRNVHSDSSDLEIFSLYNKYRKGKLVIQPDFQRQFVWDDKKSSKLIESGLLDIPLPVIYLSEEKDGKIYVIDGQQRLTSFFSFIDGRFPDGREFTLKGLTVFPEYNNKNFKELPEEVQEKINGCTIRTITFKQESDGDLKYEIFERLNTGSVSLNDQELRNCIYRGKYNDLLRRLSENDDFRYLMGISMPDRRMKDVEFVLRFAAFYHASYLNYGAPMKTFLNREMKKYQFISDSDAVELEKDFKKAVSVIRSLFDKQAFKRYYPGDERNPSGKWEPKQFNASLYDIMMYSFARADKNKVYQNADAIREAIIDLMTTDHDFITAIEKATSSNKMVTTRFDKWRMALDAIVGIDEREPRCFSRKLKEELYDRDPTCAICGQRIQSVDDAAVDHIEQYWLGGKTIPENARLAHRYCNMARPRKEAAKISLEPEAKKN